MENLKQILFAIIATATLTMVLAMVLFLIDEIARDRAERKAAEQAARQRDMIARAERIKRERMAAAREQLWLEYMKDGDASCPSHKDA